MGSGTSCWIASFSNGPLQARFVTSFQWFHSNPQCFCVLEGRRYHHQCHYLGYCEGVDHLGPTLCVGFADSRSNLRLGSYIIPYSLQDPCCLRSPETLHCSFPPRIMVYSSPTPTHRSHPPSIRSWIYDIVHLGDCRHVI